MDRRSGGGMGRGGMGMDRRGGGMGMGGGRGGYGMDRGGRGRNMRGGRGGREMRDPRFDPRRDVSVHTGKMYKAQAIRTLEKMPEWIVKGCTAKTDNENDPVITKLNGLQQKVVPDMCLGNDSIVVSAAGSGKTIAVILAAFYRLYTRKAPAHIMFICVDHLHVQILTRLCMKLGQFVPDLNVNAQVRGSRYVTARQLNEGRNIFVCSPGKAISLAEDYEGKTGRQELINHLVAVNIFDCDSLLTDPMFGKLQQTFKYIPTNINVNFVSNSYCLEMEKNIKQLVNLDAPNTHKHMLHKEYNNLKFWFVFCGQRHLRVPMLAELVKVNPFRQGVIFTTTPQQARTVMDAMIQLGRKAGTDFKARLLESEGIGEASEVISAYNSGSIQYIIAFNMSPIHLLQKIKPKNLKMIVNFELRNSSAYLKRAQICRYQSKNKKIHVISLIDQDQTRVYEQVEENCKVTLIELPSNVQSVLKDDSPSGSNNANDKKQ